MPAVRPATEPEQVTREGNRPVPLAGSLAQVAAGASDTGSKIGLSTNRIIRGCKHLNAGGAGRVSDEHAQRQAAECDDDPVGEADLFQGMGGNGLKLSLVGRQLLGLLLP